jgi:predicted transcriptional regulator
MFTFNNQEYKSKSSVARILLSQGKSKKEIANILNITEQTVHAVQKRMLNPVRKKKSEDIIPIEHNS